MKGIFKLSKRPQHPKRSFKDSTKHTYIFDRDQILNRSLRLCAVSIVDIFVVAKMKLGLQLFSLYSWTTTDKRYKIPLLFSKPEKAGHAHPILQSMEI